MSGTVSVFGAGVGAGVAAENGVDLALFNADAGGLGLDAVGGGFGAGLSAALPSLAAMLL